MLKRFYPDEYYENAYIIDYKGLYVKGYRGIIFDVDNTLVEHGAPVNDKAKDLFAKLHEMGYEHVLFQITVNRELSLLRDMLIQNMSAKPQNRRLRII